VNRNCFKRGPLFSLPDSDERAVLAAHGDQRNCTATPSAAWVIDRDDLRALLHNKPDAGIDILAEMGKQFHASPAIGQFVYSDPGDLCSFQLLVA